MKITSIKDKGIKILELDRGDYIVNGKRYNFNNYCTNKIELQDIKELKKINMTTICESYFDELAQKEISVKDYNDKIKELTINSMCDEYGLHFNSLEDEYNYKKFKQNCKPKCKTLETVTNLIIPEETVLYETGSEYIKSIFFMLGGGDPTFYKYNRPQARLDIVKDKFSELGFEFSDIAGCEITKNKKIWGNSKHSVIRYVTAFGTYIFGNGWDNECSPVDTLEGCKKMYENDKKEIESIIMKYYNQNYNTLNKEKLSLLPEMIDSLQINMKEICPYQKSYLTYKSCLKKIEDIQKLISESFDKEKE